MKFALYEFEGKELYLRQALYARGHTQAERIDDTDLLLVDTDVPWAHPRPQMIAAAKAAGAKVAVYPHGGLPDWTYDGIAEPHPDVDLRLEHGPGSSEVASLLGLDLRQQAFGWLYSPTQPFAPVEDPKRVLFAPLHPIIEGLANPETNGHDPAPEFNQRVYKQLLALGYELVVSVVGPPHRSGLWPHPRATLVANPAMGFTNSYQLVMAADVVIAAGTMAALAVACGKPTVMFAQDNFTTYANGDYTGPDNPGLYEDLIRYPLDASDGNLGVLILRACAGDPAAAEWRDRFVGNDGANAAVLALERLVESREDEVKKPKRNVKIQGMTSKAKVQADPGEPAIVKHVTVVGATAIASGAATTDEGG